jgi:hypothetical protein
MKLDLVYLKSILHYNPQTGIWTWLVDRGVNGLSQAGTKAGGKMHKIKIDKQGYSTHRLAFFYMTGRWPKDQIDHINNNHFDDRWINLREANTSQNCANQGCRKNSSIGLKGVTKNGAGFMAQINVRNKHFYLGTFRSTIEAHRAYAKAAKQMFGEFSRTK